MILLEIYHRTAERTVRVSTTYLVHVEERQTEQPLNPKISNSDYFDDFIFVMKEFAIEL